MIDKLVKEIDCALEHECFFAALTLALTLPDTCGKAAYPDLKPTKRYKKWCREYVSLYEKPSDPYGSDMPYLSGEVIYNLRNALLHQSTPNVRKEEINEERCQVDVFELLLTDVEEIPDTPTSMVAYGKNLQDVRNRELTVSIRYLCHILCVAATAFYANNADKFGFIKYYVTDRRKASNPFYKMGEQEE